MGSYTLGWVLSQSGQAEAAAREYQHAATLPSDYCFPNRLEDVTILTAAQRAHRSKRRLADVAKDDAGVTAVLGADDIDKVVDPISYQGVAQAFIDRLIASAKSSISEDRPCP